MKFIVFSCNKYDNIRRKTFNNINEVDNIKLEIGNKIEKLKLFFVKGFLKALNIFGQFLMRAFEEIRRIRHTRNDLKKKLDIIF